MDLITALKIATAVTTTTTAISEYLGMSKTSKSSSVIQLIASTVRKLNDLVSGGAGK